MIARALNIPMVVTKTLLFPGVGILAGFPRFGTPVLKETMNRLKSINSR
jgi:hypothetical protein